MEVGGGGGEGRDKRINMTMIFKGPLRPDPDSLVLKHDARRREDSDI